MLRLLAQLQKKITTRLQNKYHPEPSENQTVWKSDNQGFKATFIQTRRRGEDAETDGRVQRGEEEWRGMETTERCREAVEWAITHPHVVDKNQEGYLQSKGSQPQTRPPRLRIQHQEDKYP